MLPGGAGTAGVLAGLASYGYGTLTALLVLFFGYLGSTGSTGGGAGQGFGLAVFSAPFLATRAAGSPLVDRYGGLGSAAHRRASAAAAVGAMTSFWDLGILAAGPVAGLIAADAGFRAAFCNGAGDLSSVRPRSDVW